MRCELGIVMERLHRQHVNATANAAQCRSTELTARMQAQGVPRSCFCFNGGRKLGVERCWLRLQVDKLIRFSCQLGNPNAATPSDEVRHGLHFVQADENELRSVAGA